jgi:CheY-like chemotaxis protein
MDIFSYWLLAGLLACVAAAWWIYQAFARAKDKTPTIPETQLSAIDSQDSETVGAISTQPNAALWQDDALAELIDQRDTEHINQAAQKAAAEQAAADQAAALAAQREASEQAQRQAAQKAAAEQAAADQAAALAAQREASEQAQRQAAQKAAAEQAAADQAAALAAQRQALEQAQRQAAQAAAAKQAAQEKAALAEQLRLDAQRKQNEAAVPPLTKPASPAKSAHQTVVMIADDSKLVRIKTGRLLAQHDYQVLYAVDGQDAMLQLQSTVPDLLITDVEMPGLDGFALTTQVRNTPSIAHLPIVMITAADDKHRQEADRVGVNVLMGKPYSDEALIDHIRLLVHHTESLSSVA